MRVYSPYLTVYKPQAGNLISILERITGLYLVIFLIFNLILIKLGDYFLFNYTFYYLYFNIIKGSNVFIEFFLIFSLLNFLYHVFFLPIVISKLKNLLGDINDYRDKSYKELSQQAIISLIVLLIGVLIIYILL